MSSEYHTTIITVWYIKTKYGKPRETETNNIVQRGQDTVLKVQYYLPTFK